MDEPCLASGLTRLGIGQQLTKIRHGWAEWRISWLVLGGSDKGWALAGRSGYGSSDSFWYLDPVDGDEDFRHGGGGRIKYSSFE